MNRSWLPKRPWLLKQALALLSVNLLPGCAYYGYAVSGEFLSRLYTYDENAYVEVAHLFEPNRDVSMPEGAKRKSVLVFKLSGDGSVEVDADSVVLRHFTPEGLLITPLKTESNLHNCPESVHCRVNLIQYYVDDLPESMVEQIKFELIVDGVRKKMTYELPLEYGLNYWFVSVGM